jgi:hypothetical protein
MARRRVMAYATSETLQELRDLARERGYKPKHTPGARARPSSSNSERHVEIKGVGGSAKQFIIGYRSCWLGKGTDIGVGPQQVVGLVKVASF